MAAWEVVVQVRDVASSSFRPSQRLRLGAILMKSLSRSEEAPAAAAIRVGRKSEMKHSCVIKPAAASSPSAQSCNGGRSATGAGCAPRSTRGNSSRRLTWVRTRRSGDSHCGSRASVVDRRIGDKQDVVSCTPQTSWLGNSTPLFRSCFRIPDHMPSTTTSQPQEGLRAEAPATRFLRCVRSACQEDSASVSARGRMMLVPN
jgi:hypothetical protein